MDTQSVKRLTAPELDLLIMQAKHSPEAINDSTKKLLQALFQKLQAITVSGDDDRRELWLTVPRGSIDDFGDYEVYLDAGEVNSREEFAARWHDEYPELQKWYLLVTVVYQEIYSVFLDNTLVMQKQPETRKRFPHDQSELARWLLTAVDDAITSIKTGEYNTFVNNNLPWRKRLGKILRDDLWRVFPEEKEYYLQDIEQDEIVRFTSLIHIQPEDSPMFRLPEMSAGLFFDCCRLGYEANNYEGLAGISSRDMYRAFADGRDEGLMDLDELSTEAFASWYHDRKRGGGHPWEVCRGGNSTHISLYAVQDEKGWRLVLAGSSRGRSVETVKFYLALTDQGLPVALRDGRQIAAMLAGTDYIGIVPEGTFPRYCSMLFPDEDMLTYMNLSWEKSDQVVKAAIWYPLKAAVLSSDSLI